MPNIRATSRTRRNFKGLERLSAFSAFLSSKYSEEDPVLLILTWGPKFDASGIKTVEICHAVVSTLQLFDSASTLPRLTELELLRFIALAWASSWAF